MFLLQMAEFCLKALQTDLGMTGSREASWVAISKHVSDDFGWHASQMPCGRKGCWDARVYDRGE